MNVPKATLENVFVNELSVLFTLDIECQLTRVRRFAITAEPPNGRFEEQNVTEDPEARLDHHVQSILTSRNTPHTDVLILDMVKHEGRRSDALVQKALVDLDLSQSCLPMLGGGPELLSYSASNTTTPGLAQDFFTLGMTHWSVSWSVTRDGSHSKAVVFTMDYKLPFNAKYDITGEKLGVLRRTLESMQQYADHPCYIGFCVACTALVRTTLFLCSDTRDQQAMARTLNKYDPADPTTMNKDFYQECQSIAVTQFWVKKHSDALQVLSLLLDALRNQHKTYTANFLDHDNVPKSAKNTLLSDAIDGLSRKLSSTILLANSLNETAEAQMTTVSNLTAQRDQQIAIQVSHSSESIAIATKRDSESMKTLSVVAMVFLPSTFVASLFATPMFRWDGGGGGMGGGGGNAAGGDSLQVSNQFWIYWATAVPLTVLVVVTWWAWIWWVDRRERSMNNRNHHQYRDDDVMAGEEKMDRLPDIKGS